LSYSKPSTNSTLIPFSGRLFHRNDPAVAYGMQCLGQHRADGVVVVRGDRRDPRVVRFGADWVGNAVQVFDQLRDREVDAALGPGPGCRLHR